jgi:hypothetical protein
MKRIYTYKEMRKMHLKRATRLSPTISGVKRSGNIIVTPGEASSGIKYYHSRESIKAF